MQSASNPPDAVKTRSVQLGVGPSLFLDVVRLCAALAVAVGHLSQITSGWPNLLDYAINAVIAFFVLSGFVIRYVTVRRPGTWAGYLSDRASRIYSVLLPAMLLAIVTDVTVQWLTNGHSLARAWLGGHLLLATITNLTFTSFIWHQKVFFYTDGAMWSLCFEWAYYMLYGIAFYLTGWRRSLPLLLVGLIAGPDILALFPVWLAGCLLFECFFRLRQIRWFLPALSLTLFACAALLLDRHKRLLFNAFRLSMEDRAHLWQAHSHATGSYVSFLLPWFGDQISLNAYLWGAIFFITILFGLLLTDRLTIGHNSRFARTTRLLAEATFPLYLFHLPIFILTVAVLGHHFLSSAAKLSLLLFALLLSVFLGEVFNRFKLVLRSWFSAHLSSASSQIPTAATRSALP